MSSFCAFSIGTKLATMQLAKISFHDLKKEYFNMPDNGSINEPTKGATGTTPSTTGTTGTGSGSGTGTGTAAALSQTAHDYGQKISEVASQAKDYVSDKVSVVG